MNSLNTALPGKEAVEYSFGKAAGLYDRYARHHRIIAKRLLDFVRPDATAGSILEIGCGTGSLAVLMTECGAKVYRNYISKVRVVTTGFHGDKRRTDRGASH